MRRNLSFAVFGSTANIACFADVLRINHEASVQSVIEGFKCIQYMYQNHGKNFQLKLTFPFLSECISSRLTTWTTWITRATLDNPDSEHLSRSTRTLYKKVVQIFVCKILEYWSNNLQLVFFWQQFAELAKNDPK